MRVGGCDGAGRERGRAPAAARDAEQWEETVSTLSGDVQDWVAAGRPLWRYFLRRPRRAVVLAYGITRLRKLTAELADDGDGAVIGEAVLAGPRLGPLRHKSVLVLPREPGRFLVKSSLRRHVRKARELGVEWRFVDEPAERRRVLALAEDWERQHPEARYRNEGVDNAALLDRGLWLTAYVPPDEHVLLAIVPVDGSWACLRLFRTIGAGPARTKARYLGMQVIGEELVRRGVRWVVDERVPAALPNGLRHYQRMLGFRVHRIARVRRRARPGGSPTTIF